MAGLVPAICVLALRTIFVYTIVMADSYNYVWDQGSDLVISIVYKQGPVGEETPVDLTNYSLRMDIVNSLGERLYTFNSDDIDDVDPLTVGDQPDTFQEVTLGSEGNITIIVPRSLTLPDGELYTDISANPPRTLFNYDIFIRDSLGVQKKILKGQITVDKSYTLWS